MSDVHERDLRLRAVLEREGLGPSVWRKRDCITLVRAVIRELSGSEPALDLPGWAEGLGEQEAIRRAPREHGSLRNCWLGMLRNEPLLRRLSKATLPSPGMIALTPVRGFEINHAPAAIRGPLLGVIGPDCALWTRTHEGLARVHPAADMWEVFA